MTSPDQPDPERSAQDVRWGRVNRRRERLRAEIRRSRDGDHKVPTILALILLGWLYLILTS
jgi:hypothetical protein